MLLDLLDSNNFININITLAKIVGLEAAVYCAELLTIYKKAKIKNKLIGDDFFKIDRAYLFQRTTISVEKQLEIDAQWQKIKLLYKHQDNPDIIKIDIILLINIISNENLKLNEDLAKLLNPDITGFKRARHNKRIEQLKAMITCSDTQIVNALRGWIDALDEAGKGKKVTKESIKIFQNTLDSYTDGNADIALAIIKIATIQTYVDCAYAINIYKQNRSQNNQTQTFRRGRLDGVSLPARATKDSLGEEIF